MRFTPSMPRSFSTSNELAPEGSSDTIASGHSGDGTNPLIRLAPHTSTATNAAKPNANAKDIPPRLFDGREHAEAIGLTESAGLRAKSTASSATAKAAIDAVPTVLQSKARPFGNAVLSAATYISSAPKATATPTTRPQSDESIDSSATNSTTPKRVSPIVRITASCGLLASTERSNEFTSSASAVSTEATSISGRA